MSLLVTYRPEDAYTRAARRDRAWLAQRARAKEVQLGPVDAFTRDFVRADRHDTHVRRVFEAAKIQAVQNTADNVATLRPLAEQSDVEMADQLRQAGARQRRWRLRGFLWSESRLPRVRACGRHRAADAGVVALRRVGDSVGYAGLQTCGSPHSCPVCASKIGSVRREDILALMSAHTAEGGSAAFGAYTLAHTRTTPLNDAWDMLSVAWRAVQQNGTVRRVRSRLGHIGVIRVVEVTYGRHGWHPHIHPLHLFEGKVSDRDVRELYVAETTAWSAALKRKGWRDASLKGQRLRRVGGRSMGVDLANYISKVGYEMTHVAGKNSGKTVNHWSLLDAARRGDADALAAWHEWEEGSRGRRAITWSVGLRDRYALAPELSDDQVAGAVLGSDADDLAYIPDWGQVIASPVAGADLLEAARQGGYERLQQVADAWGITVLPANPYAPTDWKLPKRARAVLLA